MTRLGSIASRLFASLECATLKTVEPHHAHRGNAATGWRRLATALSGAASFSEMKKTGFREGNDAVLRRRRVSQSLDKLPHRLALSRVHHRLMLRLLRLMNNELADNIRSYNVRFSDGPGTRRLVVAVTVNAQQMTTAPGSPSATASLAPLVAAPGASE